MKETLKKLIKVKSIVTLTLTVLVIALGIRGVINGEQILTIYTTIIAFYFGIQSSKGD